MKKIIKFLSLVLILFMAMPLSACGYKTLDLNYFNTNVYLAVNGDLDGVKTQINTDLAEIENALSLSKNQSEVYAFNNATKSTPVRISSITKRIFSLAKDCFNFTNGAFNPAVYPILKAYNLSGDTFDSSLLSITPPSDNQILELKPLTDFTKIYVEDDFIYKGETGQAIDLGGIAKGYAVDLIKDSLIDKGITKGYVSIGGSSIYVFATEENLSIKHPSKNGNIISVENEFIENSPLSTSGDYFRYYLDLLDKSIRYSHIIDPTTCKPAQSGMRSVTVIANGDLSLDKKSACFTDAISTALCTFDKTSLINFTKNNLSGFTVFAVYEKDGVKEIISNCPSDYFEILDTDYTLVSV